MNARELATAIVQGDADDDLNAIVHAINERREIIARMKKAELKVGDRVRFTDQARHYAGQVGILERKLSKNVEVRLPVNDNDVWFAGEKPTGALVRTPASLLERVVES